MTATELLERTTSKDHKSAARPASGDDEGGRRRQAVAEALPRSGSAPSIRELPRFRGE